MKKDLGVKPFLFPMPVLMIATYGENDKVDVMNMAWGGICAENMVSLNIGEDHKTSENIKKKGCFTLSIADIPHLAEADFFGIASGNNMEDKFERSGLTAVKSEKVDAPVVEEFPLTLECICIRPISEWILCDWGEDRTGLEFRSWFDEKIMHKKDKNPCTDSYPFSLLFYFISISLFVYTGISSKSSGIVEIVQKKSPST